MRPPNRSQSSLPRIAVVAPYATILATPATPFDARLPGSRMHSASSDPSLDLRSRFEALVVPHLDRLLAFAIRRSDSVADAEDAVQEAFVRAWLGFADLRDDALARPWIYRILRTVLSDFREKHGRRQQLVFITRLEDAHDELIGGEHDELFSEVVARLDSEAIHRRLSAATGTMPEITLDSLIQTSSVAEAYWALHNQSRDGWTHELDLRPYSERW